MKDHFINSNDRLFIAINPFTGKYSVKDRDFFTKVREKQNLVMPVNWVYRPLNAEIEITNKCNQSCKHCGMASNGMSGITYTTVELDRIISQLSELGIPSISLTGGEPFVEYDLLLDVLRLAKGKVDICKITTNGFWGHNPDKYFSEMVSAGLLSNQYFIPCFMISIGEQSTPIEYACNIIHYMCTQMDKSEITPCISSLSEYGKESKVDEFLNTYHKKFGQLPEGRVFLTENFYRNSQCMTNSPTETKGRTIDMYMQGPVRCFEQTIGKYVLPRMLVKVNGDVRTCACFNPPEALCIGNLKSNSLYEVLEQINSNTFVKIIAEDGLSTFAKHIPEQLYKGIACNNECDACVKLINLYKTREV